MPRLHIITNRFPAHPDDQASPFVRDFALAAAARGVEVEVTAPGYSPRPETVPGLAVNWLPWKGGKEVVGATNPLSPPDLLALWRFLREGRAQVLETLRRRRADHCLALWALPSGWLAREAGKHLDIPYSVWCLGSDIYKWARRPVVGGIVKNVLVGAEALFADGRDLCRRTEQISGRQCEFLPSLRLLPTTDADLPSTSRRGSPDTSQFSFLYVGRFDRSKGVFLAVDAFAKARTQNPNIELNFLGWGPHEADLRNRAANLGLEETVHFHGRGGPKEVASLMGACHCLIIPSFTDSIPLVFGEALQAKIPLIVTDVGDMGPLTRDHGLGAVVRPGDHQGLARAMEAMASAGPPSGFRKRMEDLLGEFSPGLAAERFLSRAFRKGTADRGSQ